MIRIVFLRRKCIGCNACVEVAPEHWVISGKDGKSYLKKSRQKGEYYTLSLPDWEYEKQVRAAELCPVRIIRVERDKGSRG